MGAVVSIATAILKAIGFVQWADGLFNAWERKRADKAFAKAINDAPKTSQELIDIQNKGEF